MINRIFIVSNNQRAFAVHSGNENVFFCLPVCVNDNNEIENAYSVLSKTENNLSVFLKIQSSITKQQTNRVVSFLFLPFYPRFDGKIVLNVSGSSVNGAEESISLLTTAAKEQGFENVSINTIPADKIFTSQNDFLNFYQSVLQSGKFFGNNLFFESNDSAETELLIAAVKQAEFTFSEKNPALYSIVAENIKLKEENILLVDKMKSIGGELSNQLEYVDILRNTHSTRRLQDYYTNEYEVLPTWYKRFGHIIKVMTGKRTMKSLFNDNEKKKQD